MPELDPSEPIRTIGKVIPAEDYQAWSDARELLEKARKESRRLRGEAYQTGYEKGEAEGRQAVLRVLIDTQAKADKHLQQLDREVAALVIALVERIIGRTPAEERTLMAARQALSRLRKHKQVTIRVPADQVERFRSAVAGWPSPTGSPHWAMVEVDPHLGPGECVIATDAGYVRAGIDAQLQNLRQTVFDSLQNRDSEPED